MLTVVPHDTLTTVELALVDEDAVETVVATRRILQDVMSSELIAGPGLHPRSTLRHSRHDIVDRWVCVVAASTSFPGVL
jgi:hypothetical protein